MKTPVYYLNVSYRSFMVSSGVDTDSDDEATQAQKVADAKAKADEIVANIKTEEDFITQAYNNAGDDEKEAYEDSSKTLTSNTRDY
jgi:preprotein translocase subunit Sec63